MSRAAKLTPFSYVVLALVGREGAGPHDIVQMMREGSVFWTTSESHYYAEPKRLAQLGYLTAHRQPGKTRERTYYELTAKGREALTAWIAQPAGMPRVQHEAIVKLLAADFSDDETVLASITALRDELDVAYRRLGPMLERAEALPHRTRNLRLINDFARRILDAQSAWIDEVEDELAGRR